MSRSSLFFLARASGFASRQADRADALDCRGDHATLSCPDQPLINATTPSRSARRVRLARPNPRWSRSDAGRRRIACAEGEPANAFLQCRRRDCEQRRDCSGAERHQFLIISLLRCLQSGSVERRCCEQLLQRVEILMLRASGANSTSTRTQRIARPRECRFSSPPTVAQHGGGGDARHQRGCIAVA